MNKPLPSDVPKPPKATGISRRLLIAMSGLMVCIMMVFLWGLHHYAPHSRSVVQALDNGDPHTDSASSLIDKLQGQVHRPLIVSSSATSSHDSVQPGHGGSAETSLHDALSSSDFKEGSNASISVYHNVAPSMPTTTRSTTHTSAYRDPTNPLLGLNPTSETTHADQYTQQNNQTRKVAFLKSHQGTDQDTLPSTLHHLVSPYEVQAGTIIPAILVTGINSDLPGSIIAKVRRDVFDTATGNYLLIPQGTTLIGTYDSRVAYGQSRVLIVWSRLLFPNGTSFNLRGMPGADLTGMAGLRDRVDHHYLRIFGSALMFSVFGAAGQLSQPQNNSKQLTAQQIIYGAIGQQMSQTAMQLVAKNMNIQPTLTIRPGANFNVLLTRDMVLPSPYRF